MASPKSGLYSEVYRLLYCRQPLYQAHYVFNFLLLLINREEIIKAYKHLAVLLHPDKNSVPGSEEAFKILCSAKDELLNYH